MVTYKLYSFSVHVAIKICCNIKIVLDLILLYNLSHLSSWWMLLSQILILLSHDNLLYFKEILPVPDIEIHGANMAPTWVLWPLVGHMLAP